MTQGTPAKKVLIVEDEEDLREMMRDVLEAHGFRVVTATDGQAALEALAREDDVGLVLLDLLMPRMDGWDFVKRVREIGAAPHTPIVVHSSAPAEPPPSVTRVLRKPIDTDRLLAVVDEFVKRG
jgi:CheY-like chemotaxis protein